MHQTPEDYADSAGMPQEVALLNRAHAALMEACTVDEVRDVRDRAEAVRAYARKARLGREILIEAAALRLRSERRLGQLLQQLPLAKGSPGNQYTDTDSVADVPQQIRLQDVGITKSDSSRLQRIAAVPEDRFQAYIKESVAANRECSTAACLRLLGPKKSSSKARTKTDTATTQVAEAPDDTARFTTLFVQPFFSDAASVSLEELTSQPVQQICSTNSHLYFLTPSQRLTDALHVMEIWGFAYAFCLPWWGAVIADTINFASSQQLLLAGHRGELGFAPLSASQWSDLVRDGYSYETLTRVIEMLSPEPYLDLSSQQGPVNARWATICGEPTS